MSDGGARPWFFQPRGWVPTAGSSWYGSISESLTRILMCYSDGHATREEARSAADAWRDTLRRRRAAGEDDQDDA